MNRDWDVLLFLLLLSAVVILLFRSQEFFVFAFFFLLLLSFHSPLFLLLPLLSRMYTSIKRRLCFPQLYTLLFCSSRWMIFFLFPSLHSWSSSTSPRVCLMLASFVSILFCSARRTPAFFANGLIIYQIVKLTPTTTTTTATTVDDAERKGR